MKSSVKPWKSDRMNGSIDFVSMQNFYGPLYYEEKKGDNPILQGGS